MRHFLRRYLPENSRQFREETSKRISWGHWFTLFNIIIAILIASRYALNADWPNTLFGKIYFFISLLGHFSFIVFAFYLLILFPLGFIIRHNQLYRSVTVLLSSIAMTVLLVDTEVFKRFYLHLSPLVWDLLVNPDEAELSRHWQLLFVPMPLIFLLQMLYSRWCWNKLRSFNRQKWGKYVALFFLSCFTATHLLYAWADMSLYRPITAQKSNYPLSSPMTARGFLDRHNLLDRDEFEQKLETQGRLDTFFLNYPLKPLEYKGIPQRVNLLFVNLSGLSNRMIDVANMPNLFDFGQNSRRFMQHYSGGDTHTAGITSLFYGVSGRYVDAILNEKQSSLFISTLQNFDYQFGLFSYNSFADPIYQRALFSGFKLPHSQDNKSAVIQWKRWLNQRNALPFFSYIELDGLDSSVDQQFAEIWNEIEMQGLQHRTLIVVTADLVKATKEKPENSFDMSSIQVPMMLYWQQSQGSYTANSSHLDIVPTILSQFFGVTSPIKDYSQGVDLTQHNERKWILSANYKKHVAIMPNGEQYHIDNKGEFEHYSSDGKKLSHSRPPLALFLQLLLQSNLFIEK